MARLSLHLSKCHIVGNHMWRLNHILIDNQINGIALNLHQELNFIKQYWENILITQISATKHYITYSMDP